ncbi:Lipoprotein signal peptidase [gamma proteobacterium IMCC2047]|nr:Lipoprotein signal peptidase [gamma proteobacterium IMCC2047]
MRGKLIWLWLSVVVVVLDQLTKYLASANLEYGRPVELLPVFDLTLLHNTGAAFSFLAGAGGWQRWLFALLAAVVSVVLVVWLKRLKAHETWLAIALALVLGGALGNLYDRVVLGYVVDFISVHYQRYYFPAFNLADSGITVGAIMLIIDTLWFSRRSVAEGPASGKENE